MVNITIPEDLLKIISDIVANKSKQEREQDLNEDLLDRLYIEILPEQYNYYPKEKKKENLVVIEL